MRKLITCIAVAATILSGCTKVEYITPVAPNEEVEISNLELTAALPDTRTYLEDHTPTTQNVKVLWSEGDSLSVWSDKTALVHRYDIVNKFTKEDGTEIGAGYPTANFVYDPTKPGATDPNGVLGTEFYAIYPYKSETVCVGNVATINLPTEQVCDFTGNFNPDYNPMAAVGTELNGLKFKNLCGIIVIDIIPDQPLTVERIVLTTRNQPICGKANVTFKAGSDPTISFTERSQTTLTLYPENISISPKEDGTPYPFYLVVPAQTYTQLEVKIFTSYDDGSTPTLRKIRKTSMKIDGGQITRIGANFKLKTEPDPEPIPPHAYKVGDVYPYSEDGSATPVGIVFAVDAEGTSGKIVAINDCEDSGKTDFVWGPTEASVITSNTNDGLANMQLIEDATNVSISSYPAFQICQNYKLGGLDWYLPARNELETILANEEVAGSVENTWRKLNDKYGEEDYMFPANFYWTSTMGQTTTRPVKRTVYYWSYTTGNMQTVFVSDLNDTNNRFAVRAVAKFVSE